MSPHGRRLLLVSLAALVVLIVVSGALFALLATLIWSRNLDARSDGDAVLEHYERTPPPSHHDGDTRDD